MESLMRDCSRITIGVGKIPSECYFPFKYQTAFIVELNDRVTSNLSSISGFNDK